MAFIIKIYAMRDNQQHVPFTPLGGRTFVSIGGFVTKLMFAKPIIPKKECG